MKRVMLVLVVMSLANALITDVNTLGEVDLTGSVKLVTQVNTDQAEHVVLRLSKGYDNIQTSGGTGLPLENTITESNTYDEVEAFNYGFFVEFKINSKALTSKHGTEWTLEFDHYILGDTNKVRTVITLPDTIVIESTNGRAGHENGKLAVIWETQQDNYKITYSEKTVAPPFRIRLRYIAAAIGFVGLGIAYFLWKRKKRVKKFVKKVLKSDEQKEKEVEKKEEPKEEKPTLENLDIYKVLDKGEKEILKELVAQKGKCTQAHLYHHTHIPKATLSRKIANLKKKGLLEKIEKGYTHQVKLTDEFRAKLS